MVPCTKQLFMSLFILYKSRSHVFLLFSCLKCINVICFPFLLSTKLILSSIRSGHHGSGDAGFSSLAGAPQVMFVEIQQLAAQDVAEHITYTDIYSIVKSLGKFQITSF